MTEDDDENDDVPMEEEASIRYNSRLESEEDLNAKYKLLISSG